MPVTTPVLVMVAIVVSATDQTPPLMVSVRVVVAPTQMAEAPEIVPVAAAGVMVTNAVAMPVPQAPVTA
jgi:hypothetical protein